MFKPRKSLPPGYTLEARVAPAVTWSGRETESNALILWRAGAEYSVAGLSLETYSVRGATRKLRKIAWADYEGRR